MIAPGLVSVTFRKLPPARIVALAAQAELAGIEWGGDVHVPHGEIALAREVGAMTRAAGLAVSSYGSYYRAAESEGQGLAFDAVLRTALALDAPLIRVWPGRRGSADADEPYRAAVASDLCRIADLAARDGRRVACEYHGGSLTDSPDSALQLMREAAHPNLGLYWQPQTGLPTDECVAALTAVIPHLAYLHVFHWAKTDDGIVRRPLGEGAGPWRDYLRLAQDTDHTRWALLEFVKGDRPEQFLNDAKTLKDLIGRVEKPSAGV